MGRKLKKTMAVALATAVAASALPLGAALSADAAVYAPATVYTPIVRSKGEVLAKHNALIERFYPNDKEYETSLREDVINYYRWLAGDNDVKTMILDTSIPDSTIDDIEKKSKTDGTDHTAYNGVEIGGSISSENEVDIFCAKVPTYERFTLIDFMRAFINDDTKQHNYRQAILSRNATHAEVVVNVPTDNHNKVQPYRHKDMEHSCRHSLPSLCKGRIQHHQHRYR